MSEIRTGYIIPTKIDLIMNEPDSAATGVLTSDNTNPSDGDTVTIGDIVYTFKTALTTDPDTVPYEVLIGVDADTTLANLRAAINGSAGEGTTYGTGTVLHPDVTCGAVAAHAVTVTAKVAGLSGNSIAKAETSSHLDWDGTGETLSGGDINDIDTVEIGESGYCSKMAVKIPVISGSATAVVTIETADGVVLLTSSALNENATSLVSVGFVLAPTDIIRIDANADPTEEETISIYLR